MRVVSSLIAPQVMWTATKSGHHRARTLVATPVEPLRQGRTRARPDDGRVASRGQEASERLAVERLLVKPAGEEGRDLGVIDRRASRGPGGDRRWCGSRCPACNAALAPPRGGAGG